MTRTHAQGRLKGRKPIAVIDIGSNSVRLVVYEGLVRSPTVLFNEKILCGLGRGLAKTGRLEDESVKMALATLRRFKALCTQIDVVDIYVLATAAAREAENGPQFITEAEEILGCEVRVLTGKEEATYSAYGIFSAFFQPSGVVGDMGGGSVELVDIHKSKIGDGITTPLGGLRLMDMSENNLVEAVKIARRYVRKATLLTKARGRNFYAVGGTWRNLAKLYMSFKGYPLPVMHAYELIPDEIDHFLHRIARGEIETIKGIETISKNRRQLLPYGAAVLLEIIHVMKPAKIIFSGSGVREGFLFSLLSKSVRNSDPLLSATEEKAVLRARSPRHAKELMVWTAQAFETLQLTESQDEQRYREAVCYLADIAWRIHPDYRGMQAANQIAFGVYSGIDHPGRVFAALTVFYRNEGLVADKNAPEIISLATPDIIYRAKVLGAFMRISNLFCASNSGILPETYWSMEEGCLSLNIPEKYQDLVADRPIGRLQQLSKLVNIPAQYRILAN